MKSPSRRTFRTFWCLFLAGGFLATGLMVASAPAAADLTRNPETVWPPKGQSFKVPVVKDNWVSKMGQEVTGNNGGASQLKLKGDQEMSVVDVNPALLKGKVITGALLHVKLSSPDAPVLRLTVSSFASPWVEGTATNYEPQEGSSCWRYARYAKDPDKATPWTFPGSHFADAGFGRSHTIWKFADATRPDKDGWQTIAVCPDVIAARGAGLSYGFGLWDDVGSEWSYKDDKFKFIQHPNRFIYSKDQNVASTPWFEVWFDGTDNTAPDPVDEKSIAANVKDFPAGQALVTWVTPADTGSKVLGFDVTYKVGEGKAQDMPRYLIPMAGRAGEKVKMHIQDLPFEAGQQIELTITSVDAAGNRGKAVTKKIKLSDNPAAFAIRPADIEPFEPSTDLPQVANVKVAVIDLVDKVEGKTGKMVPDQPAGYKGGNHLWSAEKKIVRLQGAKNEFVAFQVNLDGTSKAATIRTVFPGDSGIRTRAYRLDYVKTANGMMPDAAVPLSGALPIPNKADPEAADQTNASLVAEIYIPHGAAAGKIEGTLFVGSDGQTLQIPIELTVWDFTLPNKLSFVPEMNAYGTVGPDAHGLAYYRLAHEHRTCLNRLPYGWAGGATLAPEWDGKKLDFSEWGRQYAPILSGTAFAGMPRKGEPIDTFYLPFNESWPMSIWDHYTPSYWPEDAFTEEYRQGMKNAYAQFVQYLDALKFHDTQFHFYLNNKVYYKAQGWEVSAAPWIFDEPVNTQDFWSLRWYALLWYQAVEPVKGDVKAWYRCDTSRSDFGRNILWGVMDVDYFGGSNEQKARQKHDEQILHTHTYFCEYGSANNPKDPNLQPVVWCLLAWSRGAIGVLPWQTIGGQGNWSNGEATSVFYPAQGGPVASVRLKAFCRGQQDVEYLTMLADAYGQPRYAVQNGLRQTIDLSGRVRKTSEEDAGTLEFDKANPTSLWQLRYRVGKMLDAKKPAYKRAVVEHVSPPIALSELPDIGYCEVAPEVEPVKPDTTSSAASR